MCGIVGYISKDNLSSILPMQVDRLFHRGPDGKGNLSFEYQNFHIGLGHTRLSILDLSEGASQPFTSANGAIVLSYNGEIYNYRHLKKTMDFPWRTSSDTELLCEGLSRYGLSFINQLSGMFAFAAWDKKNETLMLARDRVGIKPLYYYSDGQTLLFSSELKAIQLSGKKLTIDQQAIYHYLHLGYIPAPMSIYSEVRKVQAGEVIKVSINGAGLELKSEFYWKAENEIKRVHKESFGDSVKSLRQLLYESVEGHLISDVEVGSFLSGGIDSSLVTAIAQKVSPGKIKTFSIGINDNSYDESKSAESVARLLKTDHHAFTLTEQEAIEKAAGLLDIYDEPFADSSAIPTLLVSEMASKHVKVALSGDGGDELFLGYGMYQWARRLQNPAIRKIKPIVQTVAKLGSSWSYQKLAMMMDCTNEETLKSHIFSQEQNLFSEKELSGLLLKPKYGSLAIAQSFINESLLSPEEQQAFFDLKYYLPDDLLVKVDRASMHHSLEVRVPLLDHKVVEFALNLPLNCKVHRGERKRILKSVLYEHLPMELFNRPKRGFSIPLSRWLKNDLRFMMDQYLQRDLVEASGVVNYEFVEEIKKQYLARKDHLYNKLWALIVLHQFFMRHR